MNSDIRRLVKRAFQYEPTRSQEEAIRVFDRFVRSKKERILWMIKGSAGTGKTSLLQAFTSVLELLDIPYIMMSPTGRAAKVMSRHTGKKAVTVHREIYYPPDIHSRTGFRLKQNKHKPGTVFIVDEVSMISDSSSERDVPPLLRDIVSYVYQSEGNKMIFLGDEAQLPPVGYGSSPALDKSYLEGHYHLRVAVTSLMETLRQRATSSILENAVRLREAIRNHSEFYLQKDENQVLVPEDAYALQDAFYSAFDSQTNEALLVTFSNKRANQYNRQIRMYIRDTDDVVSAGDVLIAVRNNYFFQTRKRGFIANGDRLTVRRIIRYLERYGYRFLEAEVYLEDEPDDAFEVVLWLDALDAEQASLPVEDLRKLYYNMSVEYEEEFGRKWKTELMKSPFLHALQVKFAYAVTAHKAQGGEWKTLFVEKPFVMQEDSIEYKRWLYTALTRATDRVYLLGFAEDDFMEKQE